MPATSWVANRTGNANFSFIAKDRAAGAALGPSRLTATTRRPLDASLDCDFWRSCNWPVEAGEDVAQKLSRVAAPRNELRVCSLPARSGRENSGALRGSSSHVSTGDRKVSSFGGSPASAYDTGAFWKGLAANSGEPSTISIRWFTGKFSYVRAKPLGQRIVARTAPPTSPTPKKSSLVCCDRNPEPA